MIFRVLSIGCYVGILLFLFIFVRAFFVQPHDLSPLVVIASLVPIGIGLVTMIVHINVTGWMTEEEKRERRSSLGRGQLRRLVICGG